MKQMYCAITAKSFAAVVGILAIMLVLGAGTASSGAVAAPSHRGCPPGDSSTTRPLAGFNASLAQAKRAVYGRRANIQGTTYVTNARNTQLVAAMLVARNTSSVPGMRSLYATMRRRCGAHTPYTAWAFGFHSSFDIVLDYELVFVMRTSKRWYVF